MSYRPGTLVFLLVSTATSALAQDTLRLPKVLGSHMVLQRDKPIHVWGWAKKGQRVSVKFGKATGKAKAGKDGRWELQLPAQKANRKPTSMVVRSGGGEEIELTDVLVGEVWLCSGQSNMAWNMTQTQRKNEEIPRAKHPQIRLLAFGGKNPAWTACNPDSVKKFSGVGYHFGRALMKELKVPIGLIRSAVGGTKIEPWTPMVGAKMFKSLGKQGARDGNLFTRLIKPLAPMTMRGAIWYQGESNVIQGDTAIYADRQAALVAGWRKVFKQDDPSFYYVQIAPFTYAVSFKKRNKNITADSLPLFWEAQTKCMQAIENSGMVVVTDITGNVRDIHPRNKRDVGERLARWALAKNYGRDVVYSGPLYKSMKAKGKAITLSFDHVGGGLKSLDKKSLTEFMIAGADRKFVPAVAKIQGDTVVVRSSAVANPKAVRFGWNEATAPNLGNKAGLPAAPFRTDDWKPAK